MVSGGESSGYGILNVRENLWLFARIYGVPNRLVRERIDQMLDVVGLTDKANSRVSHLSTGQRQKMNFCRGFITDPKILFLDEPTLGLDVTAARTIREFIREWMKETPSRTLLLTTHYMAEADELCDRLAIIDQGKVLACDTPANLKRRVQEYPIFELSLAPGANGVADVAGLPGVHQATRDRDADDGGAEGVARRGAGDRRGGAEGRRRRRPHPELEEGRADAGGRVHRAGRPAGSTTRRTAAECVTRAPPLFAASRPGPDLPAGGVDVPQPHLAVPGDAAAGPVGRGVRLRRTRR